MTERTTLSVDSEVRDRIRAKKIGGETYSDVLERLMEQYNPDQATDSE